MPYKVRIVAKLGLTIVTDLQVDPLKGPNFHKEGAWWWLVRCFLQLQGMATPACLIRYHTDVDVQEEL